MKFKIMLFGIFSAGLIFNTNGQEKDSQFAEKTLRSSADIYWDSFPKRQELTFKRSTKYNGDLEEKVMNQNFMKESMNRTIESKKIEEVYSLQLLDWGTRFWEKFPSDKRRFEWLSRMLRGTPFFFKNIDEGARSVAEDRYDLISIDSVAKKEWDNQRQRLLKEVWNSNELTFKDKMNLESDRLSNIYKDRARITKKHKFNIKEWTNDVVKHTKLYIDSFPAERSNISSFAKTGIYFLEFSNNYKLGQNDLEYMINTFMNSNIIELQKVAQQGKSLLLLKKNQISIKTTDFKGKPFNLKAFRGRLVLLDFWGPACSTCIAKMPEIKRVWEKYRKNGFEVISVALQGYRTFNGVKIPVPEQIDRISNIHYKIGASWPLLILDYRPDKLGGKICNDYSWSSVPQLLLLDQNGLLIEYNGILSETGGLEKLVKQHLIIQKTNKR